MSLPIEENIVNLIEEPKEEIDSTLQENLESLNGVTNDVDAVGENELLVQTIRDDDPLLYENDSYVEIGRKLISAKNSIELISISHGNSRKGPEWEGGNFQLDLLRINDENQASTDISKSVILNNTNANVKANGHHVAWVDGEIVSAPPKTPDETISEVVAVPERTEMTMSNHSIPESPENPFLTGPNDNLIALSSDDDFYSNEKVDNSKLLSVEGHPIPDPEYVAKHINPAYHPLIKRNFKKDCRSWLYKNRNSQRRVQFVCDQVDRNSGKR